ncbi:MAG: PEP-CTERM sorting domain-containing protein [Planctomycetes bacterium]|nr:PEP-CTERM sorting domain-containing protein [Planctomycetota bacterium]
MRRASEVVLLIVLGVMGFMLLGNGIAQAGEPIPPDSFFDVFDIPDLKLPKDMKILQSASMENDLCDLVMTVSPMQPSGAQPDYDTFDTGGPVGSPGNMVISQLSLPSGDFAVDSFFDIMYEVLPLPGKPVADLRIDGGPFWVDSFFDVTFAIDFEGGSELLLAVHGEIIPGQEIALENVFVGDPDFPAESFFDVFFELDIPDPGMINPTIPFMEVSMVGSYTVPEPATIALLGLGGMLAAICRKKVV